jgi:GNAT superfamily N-acetyltransferase
MDNVVDLPPSPIPELKVIDLLHDGEKLLQTFFEANPLYFLAVHGTPAQPGEAQDEIHGELPSGWPFTYKYLFGYQESDGQLVAMVNVVSDLLASSIWHVGTFIVASDRHGTGVAQALYGSIEEWAQRNGARWMRLGVVQGHSRAEAFWQRCEYTQVAMREGIVMGNNANTIRVMAKPLYGQSMSEYYSLVKRDRPTTNAA